MIEGWQGNAPLSCFEEEIGEAKILRGLREPESAYRVIVFSVDKHNNVVPIDLGNTGLTLERDYEGMWNVNIEGSHHLISTDFVSVVNNSNNAGISVNVYLDTSSRYIYRNLWQFVKETGRVSAGVTLAEYLEIDVNLANSDKNPYTFGW